MLNVAACGEAGAESAAVLPPTAVMCGVGTRSCRVTVCFRAADKGLIGCGCCARSEHFGGRCLAQGHLGSPSPSPPPRQTGLPGRADDTVEEKVLLCALWSSFFIYCASVCMSKYLNFQPSGPLNIFSVTFQCKQLPKCHNPPELNCHIALVVIFAQGKGIVGIFHRPLIQCGFPVTGH